MNANLAVVHLASASLGIDPFRAFVRSYRSLPAGIDHELVVVFNGFRRGRAPQAFRDELEGLRRRELWISRRATDLSAYAQTAGQVAAEYLCCLNSRSVILDEGWLAKLYDEGRRPGVGCAGATGTWESHLTGARTPVAVDPSRLLPRSRRAVAELGRRALLPRYEHAFPPFPNPHLRTNAFLIGSELFRSLEWGRTRTKFAAHALESGYDGFSRQLVRRELRLVVVGRDGRGYDVPDWPSSRTYRGSSPENLLVADRRTEQYAHADPETRRALAELAWGGAAQTGRPAQPSSGPRSKTSSSDS